MDRDEISTLYRGFRGEESKKSANQKQESPVVAMFVMDRDGMRNVHRGSSIDASYQVSVHFAKWLQRRIIKKISQSETSRLWRPCLLTDQDEISNLYRGPSIDASYQVSVHLAKLSIFSQKIF
jgi:hypothetical protein